MPSVRFACKAVVCSLFVTAVPAAVLAQAAYAPSGGEYAVAGSLPGDQTRPALSLNVSGGFLVWQDNAIDGNGLGIAGVALDRGFSPLPSVFRVNKGVAGDQERPQVTLLNGGGAVFVWQGGSQSFQHTYARFLSTSNTWLTGDVMVNTSTSNLQANAAIATLANGNVIIVWSSFNQAGANSMLDIYGQIFSPAGQKVGSEFLINQFTDYNQRTPSVAALANGGFVVTWVSEQERMIVSAGSMMATAAQMIHPSVDIYARLFGSDGTPAGNEFLVNTGSDICANPHVAAGSDGGFMIVWGQHNAAIPAYSWDIFACSFASGGTPGTVVGVNTFLLGDQYAPQISSLGTDYFAVWTSLGQDGSAEGVYGRFLAKDGTPESGEFLVNTTTMGRQTYPAVASDNYGRFLAAWSSFNLGASRFVTYTQLYTSTNFVPPVATNLYAQPFDPTAGNPLADGGTGAPSQSNSSTNSDPNSLTLGYPGVAAWGPGVSNSFIQAKGPYNGLFYDTNGINVSSSGYFSATTTERGTYTAKITLGKRTYSISGRFDSQGFATNTLRPTAGGPSTVQLQLDLSGGDQLRGWISSSGWTALVVADRQVFYKSASRSAQAGNYTLVIPADENSPNSPVGDGFGTVSVDTAGNLQWSGSLADGSKVSQKSAVSKDGVWPLYCSLYGGSGSLIAWLQFTNQSDSDLGGQLIWTKPGGIVGKYYPAGFTNSVVATGSSYTPPSAGQRLLQFNTYGNGSLIFYGGGLTEPFTNPISVDLRNHVTSPAGSKLSFSFTPANGLFQGTTLNPETGKSQPFQGILFQNDNIGVGYWLGPSEAGGFYLNPGP